MKIIDLINNYKYTGNISEIRKQELNKLAEYASKNIMIYCDNVFNYLITLLTNELPNETIIYHGDYTFQLINIIFGKYYKNSINITEKDISELIRTDSISLKHCTNSTGNMLLNCTNCNDSELLFFCNNCNNCYYCENCNDCVNCSMCTDTNNSENCEHCVNVSYSETLWNCNNCDNCKNCKQSSDSNFLKNCELCVNCGNLSDSYQCTEVFTGNHCNQCVDLNCKNRSYYKGICLLSEINVDSPTIIHDYFSGERLEIISVFDTFSLGNYYNLDNRLIMSGVITYSIDNSNSVKCYIGTTYHDNHIKTIKSTVRNFIDNRTPEASRILKFYDRNGKLLN